MMIKTLRTMISGMTLTIFLTGCGENVQGTYVGDAMVTSNSCTGIAGGPYTTEVTVQFSDSVELVVTKFAAKTNNQADSTFGLIAGVKVNATQDSPTSFFADNQIYSNAIDTVSASGSPSSDRSYIAAFNFTHNSTIPGTNTPCVFRMHAEKLTKAQ